MVKIMDSWLAYHGLHPSAAEDSPWEQSLGKSLKTQTSSIWRGLEFSRGGCQDSYPCLPHHANGEAFEPREIYRASFNTVTTGLQRY
ncbi:hypothetical protein TNCV_486681 [Trichonephila clavipes]|nr:hypothetical protein TNCV_486681 [Trichonephila clavipes]